MDYLSIVITVVIILLAVFLIYFFLSSSSVSSSVSSSPPAFKNDIITDYINQKRAIHHAPPLQYDPIIAATAQQWADTIASSTIRHSSSVYGENIHVRYGLGNLDNQTLILNAIQSWYDEIRNYNFQNPVITSNNGHFTCLVWKESRVYGIGITRNGDRVFIVMNTFPRQVNDRIALLANVIPA
jgi:uncharacterized protein YkwD